MNIPDLLLIVGVAFLSVALRSFAHPLVHKLGSIGILATSFLIGWKVTGNPIIGFVCALSWFFLPWLELLTRVRTMRLPAEKTLRHKSPPSSEAFPDLASVTEQVELKGFEYVDDAGWAWEDHNQFFRLFYNPETRQQAAICLVEQAGLAFYYVSFSSRMKDGSMWTTWNYPFSYSLRIPPHLRVRRASAGQSPIELHRSHQQFLESNQVNNDQVDTPEPEEISTALQDDLRRQIAHNVDAGLLRRVGDNEICYSWRGLCYLWIQFLKDIFRLS